MGRRISVVHNTIWNVTDPYNTFSSTSDVLDELRDYWVNNNSSIKIIIDVNP